LLHPPVFKFCSMFFPQFVKPRGRQCQFGRVRFARQANRCKHPATIGLDVALQVRKRAAHAHKVVHQYVVNPGLYNAGEFGLPRHTRKAICPGVSHNVHLCHANVVWPAQGFADFNRKALWDGVDAFSLVRMRADQDRSVPLQQMQESMVLGIAHRAADQRRGRCAISRLRSRVSRVLFHRRLAGVNQHIGEVAPRCTRRVDKVEHAPDFPMQRHFSCTP